MLESGMLFFLPGVFFIILGYILLKFPPKKINYIYGYRTSQSMKSKDRWDFAQSYSSKEMIKLGIALLIIGGLMLLFDLEEKNMVIIFTVCIIILFAILFFRTEKELKRNFNGSS